MARFVISDDDLRRLSPDACRELLDVLAANLADAQLSYTERAWNPDGNTSYPLSTAEAHTLIRSLSSPGRHLLRLIARHFDGSHGRAELDEMLAATRFESYQDLGQEVSSITQLLRSVTGNSDAWLFNWYAKDWDWDEEKEAYTRGAYFIAGKAVESLRVAFGLSH